MRFNCVQLITGLIFKTNQEFVYSSKTGYALDVAIEQGNTTIGSNTIAGSILITQGQTIDTNDFNWKESSVVASWIEEA